MDSHRMMRSWRNRVEWNFWRKDDAVVKKGGDDMRLRPMWIIDVGGGRVFLIQSQLTIAAKHKKDVCLSVTWYLFDGLVLNTWM